MSIRSNIACLALGCVVLSAVAYAGEPPSSQSNQEGASDDKARHDKRQKGKSVQPAPTGALQDGSEPAAPAAATAAGGTSTAEPPAVLTLPSLQQLGCAIVGAPVAGQAVPVLTNSTPAALPVGTVIWFGPPGMAGKDGVTRPSRGLNPDGTPGHMDRYMRLTSEMRPAGVLTSSYSPAWVSCVAVVGMASLIPEVAFVE